MEITNEVKITQENIDEILSDSWRISDFEDFRPEEISEIEMYDGETLVFVRGKVVKDFPGQEIEEVPAEMLLTVTREDSNFCDHMFRDGKIGIVENIEEKEVWDMKKKVAISITLNIETVQKLTEKAEKENKSLSTVIQEILEKLI